MPLTALVSTKSQKCPLRYSEICHNELRPNRSSNTDSKKNCSRYRPGVAQRVSRGIALFFHDRGTRRGWVVSSTPRPHFTPGKDLLPILQEAGWAPGPVWTGRNSRPHRDSIPERPARSQSLYRLSYLSHNFIFYILYFNVVKAIIANKTVIRFYLLFSTIVLYWHAWGRSKYRPKHVAHMYTHILNQIFVAFDWVGALYLVTNTKGWLS